ncbi:hypothetical protein VKT23_013922 [Stygiomarasmius scandens]|uniref:Uncharacterized protein n=1 Tax=Marasmiellus scandens TaxID=2682957 RepID=A0ABR1J1F6_9AGAR
MTCAPYRPITLTILDVSISDVNARALVSADLSRKLKIDVELYIGQSSKDVLKNLELSFTPKKHGNPKSIAEMRVGNCDFKTILGPEGITAAAILNVITWNFGSDDGRSSFSGRLDMVNRLCTMLKSSCLVILGPGLVVQEKLQEADQCGRGKAFLFEINGMGMGASNWIPASSFLTTLTDERYRA